MGDALQVVAIVVDPEFGDRVDELLVRMPVWIADTKANHDAAVRLQGARAQSDAGDHTAVGALTIFRIDPSATPESWCLGILHTVAGHHDQYSHSPGYSGLEIYGMEATPQLLAALAEYGLTDVAAFQGGLKASTSDGQPAGSPTTRDPVRRMVRVPEDASESARNEELGSEDIASASTAAARRRGRGRLERDPPGRQAIALRIPVALR